VLGREVLTLFDSYAYSSTLIVRDRMLLILRWTLLRRESCTNFSWRLWRSWFTRMLRLARFCIRLP